MALTADGRQLIVAETLRNRLSAFKVTSNSLGPRRTWAAFGAEPAATHVPDILNAVNVAPDGICLDAQGAVWVADVARRRLIRVREGGQVLEQIEIDGLNVFACMLGGNDRRTLFACVAPTFHEAEAAASHRAEIWMTRVETPGAGLP
jgi:sugar lactone lactonase YvrE